MTSDKSVGGYETSAVDSILYAIFYLLDQSNELYLTTCVAPFLSRYKSKLNRLYFHPKIIRLLNRLPSWCIGEDVSGIDDRNDGANYFFDYLRGALVVPTLQCLSMQNVAAFSGGQCQYSQGMIGGQLFASVLVCVAYALRHIPVAVKRVQLQKNHHHRQQGIEELSRNGNDSNYDSDSNSSSHLNSSHDKQRSSNEMQRKIDKQLIPSWNTVLRNKHYHQLLQSLIDALFFIPIWICLLGSVSPVKGLYNSWHSEAIENVCLWCLILTISSVTAQQCHYYYTMPLCSLGNVHDELFSRRVNATINSQSTAKSGFNKKDTGALCIEDVHICLQLLSSIGTAFYIIPPTRSLGVFFFIASLPLLYTLLYQSLPCTHNLVNGQNASSCTIYVSYYNSIRQHKYINANVLQFWYHAKGLGRGSRLVVGIPSVGCDDAVLDVCAVSCVDDVLLLNNDVIPDKIDKVFLHEWGIDYVALRDDKAGAWKKMVDTEVCNDGHCILFSENGVARAVSLSDMKA